MNKQMLYALKGRSEIRNTVIARVFKELDLVEQWGSGIQRIKEYCTKANIGLPVFSESGDFIDWKFPRKIRHSNEVLVASDGINDGINHQIAIPKNIQPLLTCIKHSPSLSTKVFANKLNLGTATVERHIKWLKDHKVIKLIGSNKDGYWQVLNNEK